MARAFVALGSNIDPERNVPAALQRLAQAARVLGISMVYRTPAEGRPEQPAYYNCVAEVETAAAPLEFRLTLRQIEAALGRRRTADKYAARTIDLDLILYDELVFESDELTLPDPLIARRAFLACGILELAPELRLPGSGRPIAEIAASIAGTEMEPLEDFTARLRRQISSAQQ